MALSNIPSFLQKDPWSGIGTDPLWGYGPALDLVSNTSGLEEVNLLLIGAVDCRHILRTVAKLARGKQLKITLYEPNLRSYARQLLFLHFLYELDENSDLEDKTYTFLELLGNCKVRESTYAWVKATAKKLSHLLTSSDSPETDAPKELLSGRVHLRHLKSKERDFIEDQLLYWADETRGFSWENAWDERMRRDLAERYDARVNVIDWDYHMGVSDLAPLVKFPEYRQFRNTGLAYDQAMINPFRESSRNHVYTSPNKTLLHWDRIRKQASFQGDIRTGPFSCFGIQTESPHLVKRDVDGSYRFGSQIVSFHNVRALLYEWVTGREWPWAEHVFHWDAEGDVLGSHLPPPDGAADLGRNRVQFWLGTLELRTLTQRMQREGQQVHVAYLSLHGAGLLCKELCEVMHPESGKMVFETAKQLLELRDEQREAYVDQVVERAQQLSWVRSPDEEAEFDKHRVVEPHREGKAAEKRAYRLALPNYIVTKPLHTQS
eukprot:TRINITY_DN5180_c0_g1_i1.p1 TRINITY_DN5180_c0_g1~~TRINITY_DN5180_c0_g1_i1.p1  ORF type:complete len:491 (-),score=72.06 TRINITY_DN5180_c0_g1_i1:50-1522(-)